VNYLYSVSCSKGEPDLLLQHVPGAAAHKEAEKPVLQAIEPLVVIEAESCFRKPEADLPIFPGGERDALIVLQFLHRAHKACRHVLHIELNDLGTGAPAGVFQARRNLQRI